MKLSPSNRSTVELLASLRSSSVLGGLDERVLDQLAAEADSGTLGPGETLFEQGDPADAMFLVLSGTLEAVLRQEDGSRLVLSEMAAGDTVGEIQILTAGARTASVRAATDVELARWPKSVVDKLADRHPQLVQRIADVIRERLRRDQLVAILPRLFGSVEGNVLRDVEEAIEWVHLRRGERLFRRGDPGDCLYFNISGRLSVVVQDADGKPHVVGQVPRGESVGEMAVFTGEARTADVYAVRDSDLAKISRTNFERFVQRHPRLLTAITKTLIQRLQQRGGPAASADRIMNVAVVPVGPDVPLSEFTRRLVRALGASESTAHLSSRRLDEHLELREAAQLPEDNPFNIRVRAWLDQLEARHRFVVYEADPSDSPWTRRCVTRADQVLLVARAEGSPEVSDIERDVLHRESRITAARRRLILLHADAGRLPSGTLRWLTERDVEMHHHVRWEEDEDFRRLARFLCGRAIGLVLGGGGARGMAHVGVIRALEERGIPIDIIGGTSAGALVSTQYAMGMDQQTMRRKNREAFVDNNPFRAITIPIVSIVSSKKMDRMAREMYGDARLEDLWINCFCVSCNLSTSETVVQRTGPVWRAVRASSALPGIAVPVVESSQLLVDGGIVDNLPGLIMKGLCGGYVILVDVSPDEDLNFEHAEIPSASRILWSRLAPHRRRIEVPTIASVLVRTAVISSVKRREEARREAILFFRPPVQQFKLLEFASFERIVDVGYRYALEKLDHWKDRDQFVERRDPDVQASP